MQDFGQRTRRLIRGRRAEAAGRGAEDVAAAALEREGWAVLARRARTPVGEIDVVAERDGLLAFVEVKARPSLHEAAYALGGAAARTACRGSGVLGGGEPRPWSGRDALRCRDRGGGRDGAPDRGCVQGGGLEPFPLALARCNGSRPLFSSIVIRPGESV